MPTPPQQNGNGRKQATPRFGLIVTNSTKLGGLVLAMRWGLFKSDDPHLSIVLAISALMMAGAQGLETFLDKLFKSE